MTFADHIEALTDKDVDLAEVEAARAAEIAEELLTDPATRDGYALKAAKSERKAWQRAETETLGKQFALSAHNFELFELDPDLLVPLGGNHAVRLGSMTREERQLRREMRNDGHRREAEAFDVEMRFWDAIDAVAGTGTIDNARDTAGDES
jgi:hypothetical protein